MAKGRKANFRPRLTSTQDRETWDAVARLYGDEINEKARSVVVANFISFYKMNQLLSLPLTLKYWAGAMINDGNKWSTVSTYSAYITKAVFPDLSPVERVEWRALRRIIRSAHADEDTTSAPVCGLEVLPLVLRSLPLQLRRAVAAISFTGVRMADLRRLRNKQMCYRRNAIKVQVRVSKNRKTRAKRRVLRIQNVLATLGLQTDFSLLNADISDKEARPFSSLTTTKVNAALKEVCGKNGWARFTTYSFRKFFVQAVSRYCNYKWIDVIDFTLHCGIDVVAAHYDLQNVLDEDEDTK